MYISQTNVVDVNKIATVLKQSLENQTSLEDAAKLMTNEIYENYQESIVLIRAFVAIQYAELPNNIQSFADNLADTKSLKLNPNSFILTLFGTTGKEPEWNDRLKSNGHQGIPLASSDFVAAIPMMSALMEQLGFDLGWIRGEPDIVAKHIGKLMGAFYVRDAATSVDSKNRKIIAAQDFVKTYNVKTVFGFGGGYAVGGKMLTVICFTNETLNKDKILLFQSLGPTFTSRTLNLIQQKNYF